MAIAQEDRHPVVEIMQQTPDIPESCQWAIFLRNHDELTLEMVTSKERDYMYQMYAADQRARLNLGIRRRLAPLMDNDIERIKLMNALLMSMPGSPIIYYGDEIGMGDNVYLGDRDGVRTPMQWSPDRNAGFSRADPQRLFLPPIMDPVYGYEAVNVEAQTRDPSSLLNWTRHLLAVRKSHRAFGRGTLVFLHPGNRKILAFLREYGGQTLLCVANLARTAQPVELDLAAYKGRVPVELLGRTAFPPVGEQPYLITLHGHAFYWFRLAAGEAAPNWHEARMPAEEAPTLVFFDGWHSLFRERVVPWRIGLAEKLRAQLEREALPRFVAKQRWYGNQGSPITQVALLDHNEWNGPGGDWFFALFRVDSEAGGASAGSGSYFLPLALVWESDEERTRAMLPLAVARVRMQARLGILGDAFADEAFARALVEAIGERKEFRCAHGSIRCTPSAAFADLVGADPALLLPVRPPAAQSSNSIRLLGNRLFLKLYRRLQAGVSCELQIGRFLTEVAHFRNCVPVAGAIEYLPAAGGDGMTLALLQAYVENQGDGWNYTLDYLDRYLENAEVKAGDKTPASETHGAYLALVRTLGRRTAELHQALAMTSGDPLFDPVPIGEHDLALWIQVSGQEAVTSLTQLQRAVGQLEPAAQKVAESLLGKRRELLALLENAAPDRLAGLKIRHHGDYHLGQVLVAENDFIIIDFEGEPARDLVQRQQKNSPLRDVAGMLRSFDYAARTALARVASDSLRAAGELESLAAAWQREVDNAFLQSYAETVAAGAAVLYADWSDARRLLDLFVLEKALYELRYELAHRPDCVHLPLRAILAALAAKSGGH